MKLFYVTIFGLPFSSNSSDISFELSRCAFLYYLSSSSRRNEESFINSSFSYYSVYIPADSLKLAIFSNSRISLRSSKSCSLSSPFLILLNSLFRFELTCIYSSSYNSSSKTYSSLFFLPCFPFFIFSNDYFLWYPIFLLVFSICYLFYYLFSRFCASSFAVYILSSISLISSP